MREQILAAIADQLYVPVAELTPEAILTSDLGADLSDLVELIMRLEDEFQIDIPDAEAVKLLTVEDVVDYVEKNSPRKG